MDDDVPMCRVLLVDIDHLIADVSIIQSSNGYGQIPNEQLSIEVNDLFYQPMSSLSIIVCDMRILVILSFSFMKYIRLIWLTVNFRK